jgi:hypothetical protein
VWSTKKQKTLVALQGKQTMPPLSPKGLTGVDPKQMLSGMASKPRGRCDNPSMRKGSFPPGGVAVPAAPHQLTRK